MASTNITIRGVLTAVYVTSVVGTVTNFIRVAGLSTEELAFIDAEAALAVTNTVTLEAQLTADTYAITGQNAWARFGGMAEAWDSAGEAEVLNADAAVAAGATPTKAEFDVVVAMVNAMRDNFDANRKHN